MLFGEHAWEQAQSKVFKAHEAGRLPIVRFRRHQTFEAPEPGLVMLFASITPRGEVMTQWATPEDTATSYERVTMENGVTYTPSSTSRPVRHVVVSGDHQVVIEESRRTVPFAQMLSDGSVIQVGARASWNPDGGERNAGHYSSGGVLLHEACVGDGVAEMYVDQQDRLWIGYSDEGVFGSFDWGTIYDYEAKEYYQTETPIGSAGLNRFRSDLSLEWEYPNGRSDEGIPFIAEIYALNVGAASVWNSAYYEFGITQITEETVEVISESGPSATQLVTDGERFASLYPYGPDILNYGVHVSGGVEHRGIGVLRGPDGGEVQKVAMHVRDGELFAVTDNELWKLDIDEIARLDRGASSTWIA
ncbi:MAG: hypothetical protein ACK5LO_13280 [Leucobacter sp.]